MLFSTSLNGADEFQYIYTTDDGSKIYEWSNTANVVDISNQTFSLSNNEVYTFGTKYNNLFYPTNPRTININEAIFNETGSNGELIFAHNTEDYKTAGNYNINIVDSKFDIFINAVLATGSNSIAENLNLNLKNSTLNKGATGGHSNFGSVRNITLTMDGGSSLMGIFGGKIESYNNKKGYGDASNVKVIVKNNASGISNIYVAKIDGYGSANYNKAEVSDVIMYNGNFQEHGNIFGGYINNPEATAQNNEIILSGVMANKIYGGYNLNEPVNIDNITRGNKLTFLAKKNTINNFYNVEILSFEIPYDAINGQILNEVTDASGVDLSKIKQVALSISKQKDLTNLTEGQYVKLISNENGSGVTGYNGPKVANVIVGGNKEIEFQLTQEAKDGAEKDSFNAIYSKSIIKQDPTDPTKPTDDDEETTKPTEPTDDEEAGAGDPAHSVSTKLATGSYDFISGSLAGFGVVNMFEGQLNQALSNLNNISNSNTAFKVASENTIATDAVIGGNYKGSKFNGVGGEDLIIFANVGGNFADYDNGVELDGVSALAGIAAAYDNGLYGAFVEYGYADFESAIKTSTTDGEANAYGLGFLTKHFLSDNFYIDTYAKVGKIETEQTTLYNSGQKYDFDLSRTYYSLGANFGYFADYGSVLVDTRLGYAFAYIDSQDKVISGDEYKFNAVKSNKAKFDAKLGFKAGNFTPYIKAIA